jgi:phosphotransferase system  glucose/maltose/N-acetylglucosamine-specific IIC component
MANQTYIPTAPIAVLVLMLTIPITYVIYAVIPWPEPVLAWFGQAGAWIRSFLPVPRAVNSFLLASLVLSLVLSGVFSCWLYLFLLRSQAKIKAGLAKSVQDKDQIDAHRAEAAALKKLYK